MSTLGRRALASQQALDRASANVIKSLTDERMAQCFPTYAADYPELMKALKKLVTDGYNERVPQAWKVVTDSCDFVERANELDDLLAEAEERRQRGEQPEDMWLKCSDAHVTVPNATVPLINTAAADLRAKRIALAEKNQATYDSIVEQHATAERIDLRLRQLISDFEKSMEVLQQVDFTEIEKLQGKMIQAMPMQ